MGHSLGGLVVAGLVLLDAAPKEIAIKRAVQAGFIAAAPRPSSAWPTGLASPELLAIGKMPAYPEQAALRRALGSEDYRRWTDSVVRTFGRVVAREPRTVQPTVRAALAQRSHTPQGPVRALPVAMVTSRAIGAQWVTMQTRTADSVGVTTRHFTYGRCHNIHLSHPGAVVDAIRQGDRAISGDGSA